MPANAHHGTYRPYRPGGTVKNSHHLTQVSRKPLPRPVPPSDPPAYRSTSRISTVGQSGSNQWSHSNEFTTVPAHPSTQEVHYDDSTDYDIGPKLLQPPALPVDVWSVEANRNGNPWQTGFWVRFPMSGVVALIGALLCTCAAIATLVLSDHRRTDDWGYGIKPTVHLSVATALTNVLLSFALAEGVVISFWRQAKHRSTLRDLHQYWLSGNSLLGALQGTLRRTALVVGFACIMTTVSIARGPLLQQATSVRNILLSTQDTMEVHVAQQLPQQYTSVPRLTRVSAAESVAYLTSNFTRVLQSYQNHENMVILSSSCGDSCSTSVKAFGFGVTCTNTTVDYDFGLNCTAGGACSIGTTVNVFSTNASMTSIDTNKESPGFQSFSALQLLTSFIADPSGSDKGTMLQKSCTLRSGIVEYPILITNGTVSFLSRDWRNDTFVEELLLDPIPSFGQGGYIVAGFAKAASDLFSSTASMYDDGVLGVVVQFSGLMANQYLKAGSGGTYPAPLDMSWNNPMDDMINTMRQIAFRTALHAAADNPLLANSTQTTSYTGAQNQIIYVTDYRFLVFGAVVSLLGILAVMPTLWGWWDDGREVSLSPLEVAKAFDAPLLTSADCNATSAQLLRQVGSKGVRYGAVDRAAPETGLTDMASHLRWRKLVICEASLTSKPGVGTTFY